MASDVSGTRSVHNTLTNTVVDAVTLQGHWAAVEVINREAAEGTTLWVSVAKKGDTLADPTAAANETIPVPAGTSVVIEVYNGASVQPQVKIIGSGNAYSVVGLPSAQPTRALLIPAAVA